MATKVALVVAALLMLVSAFFSYTATQNVTKLRDDLKIEKEQHTTTRTTLARTKEDLEKSQGELTAARQQVDTLTSDLNAAKSDLNTTKQQLVTAQADLQKAKDDLAAAQPGPTGPTAPGAVPAGPSPEELTRMQTELAEAKTLVSKLTQERDSAKSEAKDAQSQVKTLTDAESRRKAGIMRLGLEGQVLAVNPGWNFVVLSLGDRQGAVRGAEMIVVRNGERVGKVRITSVEPATSVADVIPGSLSRGVRLQPGDRVIVPPPGS